MRACCFFRRRWNVIIGGSAKSLLRFCTEVGPEFSQHGAHFLGGGFIIQGGTPDTFPRFVDQVVPVLQARGLFRTDYPGTTLRESLGLDEPKNQFTQQ